MEEEQKQFIEPAPIPRRPTMERTVGTWDQLQRQSRAMNKSAVSETLSNMLLPILSLLNGSTFASFICGSYQ